MSQGDQTTTSNTRVNLYDDLSESRREQIQQDLEGSPVRRPQSTHWNPFAREIKWDNQHHEARLAASYVLDAGPVTSRYFKGVYFDREYPDSSRMWCMPSNQSALDNAGDGMLAGHMLRKALDDGFKNQTWAKKIEEAEKKGQDTFELKVQNFMETGALFDDKVNQEGVNRLTDPEKVYDAESMNMLKYAAHHGIISADEFNELKWDANLLAKGVSEEEWEEAQESFLQELGGESVPHDENTNTHAFETETDTTNPDFDYDTFVKTRKFLNKVKQKLAKDYGFDVVNSPNEVYEALTEDWANSDPNTSIWGKMSKDMGLDTSRTLSYEIPRVMFEVIAPNQPSGMQAGDWIDGKLGLDGRYAPSLCITGYTGDANSTTRLQTETSIEHMAELRARHALEEGMKHIGHWNRFGLGMKLMGLSFIAVTLGAYYIERSTLRSRDMYWTLFKWNDVVRSMPEVGKFATESQIHEDIRVQTWLQQPYYNIEDDDEDDDDDDDEL